VSEGLLQGCFGFFKSISDSGIYPTLLRRLPDPRKIHDVLAPLTDVQSLCIDGQTPGRESQSRSGADSRYTCHKTNLKWFSTEKAEMYEIVGYENRSECSWYDLGGIKTIP